MYNFYQSKLRKYFNTEIAHKPTWVVELFGETYQYIIRQKRIWIVSACWIQILGIVGINNHTLDEWRFALSIIQKKHNPIFIQLWSTDIITIIPANNIHNIQAIENAKKERIASQEKLLSRWWILAKKENLPPSTYIVNINNTLDNRMKLLWSQHISKIKKAQKNGILVSEAQWWDHNIFFSILQQTWKEKWFNVIWSKTFSALIEWMQKENTWKLFIAKQWNEIVAWAIYLTDTEQKTAIYLYWWTDKTHRNSWASQLLHREIMNLLQHKWFETIDLLWWWPTWFPEHHLSSVWTFKEWFGWDKIDYIWSYDIPYKKLLYKIWTTLR